MCRLSEDVQDTLSISAKVCSLSEEIHPNLSGTKVILLSSEAMITLEPQLKIIKSLNIKQ